MLQRLAPLFLLGNSHIQNRNTNTPHPIHLRDNFPQPGRAARDNHHLALPVQFSRRAPRQPVVQFTQQGEERYEGCVEACVLEVRMRGWVGEGAQAEWDQPGDEGAEDRAG